jgi:hypothetical protein
MKRQEMGISEKQRAGASRDETGLLQVLYATKSQAQAFVEVRLDLGGRSSLELGAVCRVAEALRQVGAVGFWRFRLLNQATSPMTA